MKLKLQNLGTHDRGVRSLNLSRREESGIPALYTYLGQFVDPDMTFDSASSLQQQAVANAMGLTPLTPIKIGKFQDDEESIAHPEPAVVVGVSPSCPYGIGACWGGAFDALKQLNGVAEVRPLPDTADSTAFVYLKDDLLPEIDAWRDRFAEVANGSYIMRGIEMTLVGEVTDHFGLLTLVSNKTRPDLVLAPLQGPDKIQWDFTTRSNQPMTAEEASAYARLSAKLATQSSGTQVQVTGPLKKNGSEFFLEVREFKV